MRPRNDIERRVVELSTSLPSVMDIDIRRMENNFDRYYKQGFCYYLILEACNEFQVIRYYYYSKEELFEFMQIWISGKAKIVMAKNRFRGVDRWIRSSEMTIKDWLNPAYDYTYLGGVNRIPCCGSFVRSITEDLKKRGFRNSSHGIHPIYLCSALLNNNRIETLFKVRQYRLLRYFVNKHNEMTDTLWKSIRIALRHGYHWDTDLEVSDWCDMISDLGYLGHDTNSPHYICPASLNEAHTYWSIKANLKRFLDRERKKVEAYEPKFKTNRERFFDLLLKDKEIEIKVIPTAMDIVKEGAHMCHCVGGYYNRPMSLILSAKINGKRIETIEVGLNDYRLIQSRGVQNKPTKYHQRIVDLINNNMDEIKKRNVKLRKAM